MSKLKKVLLVGVFMVINGLVMASNVSAGWEREVKITDGDGNTIGYICEGCWLWGCDCNDTPAEQ
ncbi:MAG TPA: hypothetical protein VEQ60_31395 [Longimicrobium sp.]|nr:hypothetical protein [Longimicrobium sp.]